MDFIKKHYEKVALAVALLILIASAISLALKVGALSTEIQEAPRRPKPKGEAVKPTGLGDYTNAIVSLKEPTLWTINPSGMWGEDIRKTPTETSITPVFTNTGPRIVLARVAHQQFKLRFDAYSGKGENFQLNFQFRPRTFFVPAIGMEVGDQFEHTGYMLAKFESKTCRTIVPGVGEREVDCSEVTLQRANEHPILLVLGKPTEEDEPVATILCVGESRPREVRRGQEFECEGTTYKVVDIAPKQMIIVEKQTGKKHTIGSTAARD
jgi:hypothetical protein